MKSHYSYAKAQGDANHSWQSWGHRYLSAYGALPQAEMKPRRWRWKKRVIMDLKCIIARTG